MRGEGGRKGRARARAGHTGKRLHKCGTCAKCFTLKNNLKTHMRIHEASLSARRSFECQQCGKRLTEERNLIRHVNLVHSKPKERGNLKDRWTIKCKLCDKKFRSTFHLNQHERIHTGEKPFGCDICGKSFRLKQSLEGHLVIHQADPSLRRPFQCTECGNRFTDKSYLRKHNLMVHQNRRPIRRKQKNKGNGGKTIAAKKQQQQCPHCHEKFPKDRLKLHMRSHREVKEKRKRSRASFAQDKNSAPDRTHMEPRPSSTHYRYSLKCGRRVAVDKKVLGDLEKGHASHQLCYFCDKKFQTLSLLYAHLKRHTSEKF